MIFRQKKISLYSISSSSSSVVTNPCFLLGFGHREISPKDSRSHSLLWSSCDDLHDFTWLRFQLQHLQQTVITSTRDAALIFVPRHALQMDVVRNRDLFGTTAGLSASSEDMFAVWRQMTYLLAEVDEHRVRRKSHSVDSSM